MSQAVVAILATIGSISLLFAITRTLAIGKNAEGVGMLLAVSTISFVVLGALCMK